MASPPHQPDAPPPPPGAFDVPVAADSPTSFSSLSAIAAPEQTDPPPHRPGGAQPWIVGAGIAAAVLLSLVAIALLYYKWYKTDEYPTTIIVWAEKEWEGGTVTVSGSGLPAAPLSKELTANDGLVIRFHVPPGAYLVRVSKDGHTIAERFTDRPLSEQMIWWPFRRPPPPATQAGAK